MRASILGGAGYVGGELARLLLGHPVFDLVQATSRSHTGRPLHTAHPNLRGAHGPSFTDPARLERVDVLFSALPRGEFTARLDELRGTAGLLVDLSPDFRLHDPEAAERHYGAGSAARAADATAFVPGLPEVYRDRLRTADRIAVPGCMATAAVLALRPLADAALVDGDVLVDARTGSSGSGHTPGAAGHHPERASALRVYGPVGHRHEPEITQHTGVRARMTVTAVPAVRGVQVVAQVRPGRTVTRAEVWSAYRKAYAGEPFVRLVAQRQGLHRLPEPRVLLGSNHCDIGFDLDDDRIVAVAALDNLVKGAAGGAVQSANIATGLPERSGLDFPGLHPL
ncbi:N-acetyl-gamma-glutamyl-phosphate reductase [Streptomyces sp. NPDC029526]|uniref:N-acetyl-gamma-glutamyl-phosphate reductase n=1 Tax=Streptomyces sp. NPDC029526 TaxID=3155728 RepID=UPI0033DC83F8